MDKLSGLHTEKGKRRWNSVYHQNGGKASLGPSYFVFVKFSFPVTHLMHYYMPKLAVFTPSSLDFTINLIPPSTKHAIPIRPNPQTPLTIVKACLEIEWLLGKCMFFSFKCKKKKKKKKKRLFQ